MKETASWVTIWIDRFAMPIMWSIFGAYFYYMKTGGKGLVSFFKSLILLLLLVPVARADDIISFNFSQDTLLAHTFTFGPFDEPSTISELVYPGSTFNAFLGGSGDALAVDSSGTHLWGYCDASVEDCGGAGGDWLLTFQNEFPVSVVYGASGFGGYIQATGTFVPGKYTSESGAVMSIVDPPSPKWRVSTPEGKTIEFLVWFGLIALLWRLLVPWDMIARKRR